MGADGARYNWEGKEQEAKENFEIKSKKMKQKLDLLIFSLQKFLVMKNFNLLVCPGKNCNIISSVKRLVLQLMCKGVFVSRLWQNC